MEITGVSVGPNGDTNVCGDYIENGSFRGVPVYTLPATGWSLWFDGYDHRWNLSEKVGTLGSVYYRAMPVTQNLIGNIQFKWPVHQFLEPFGQSISPPPFLIGKYLTVEDGTPFIDPCADNSFMVADASGISEGDIVSFKGRGEIMKVIDVTGSTVSVQRYLGVAVSSCIEAGDELYKVGEVV